MIKPDCSLTIMIFVFTVFITVNNLEGKWGGLLGSHKVSRHTFILLKNINMNINATLFYSRHILVAKWNLF